MQRGPFSEVKRVSKVYLLLTPYLVAERVNRGHEHPVKLRAKTDEHPRKPEPPPYRDVRGSYRNQRRITHLEPLFHERRIVALAIVSIYHVLISVA